MEYTFGMLLLGILLVSLATVCLPIILRLVNKNPSIIPITGSYNWLPAVAGLIFFIAWFIPDIGISSETTTFQQHFVGGGIYSALLYIYFKHIFGLNRKGLTDIACLFAWVSSFGVASELLEFTLTKLGLAHIPTGDTDWDLLANTAGAFLCYTAYILVQKVSKHVR